MQAMPLLTLEELAGLREATDGPGQLAKTWMALTRLAQERLQPDAGMRWMRNREKLFCSGTHYLRLALDWRNELLVEFGTLKKDGQRNRIGHLHAHWDVIGLTGPYRVLLRERTYSLATFHAAMEPYLALPPAAQRAA